jgi:hypothetical protein
VLNFFKFPKGTIAGEASAVAVNSKGHIFLFQRTKPMLAEHDAQGNFIQTIGDGLFSHPNCGSTPTTIFGRQTTEITLCSSWIRPATSYSSWAESTPAPRPVGCSTSQPMSLSQRMATFT